MFFVCVIHRLVLIMTIADITEFCFDVLSFHRCRLRLFRKVDLQLAFKAYYMNHLIWCVGSLIWDQSQYFVRVCQQPATNVLQWRKDFNYCLIFAHAKKKNHALHEIVLPKMWQFSQKIRKCGLKMGSSVFLQRNSIVQLHYKKNLPNFLIFIRWKVLFENLFNQFYSVCI